MSGPGTEEHPTACSMQIVLELGNPLQAAEISERIDAFLSDLMNFLRDNGCKLIGHIKGLLDAADRGQLFFSITSFDEAPRYKGGIDGQIAEAELSINVIVYGIDQEPIETAVRKHITTQFPS